MKEFTQFIQGNRALIDNYLIITFPSGEITLYFSTTRKPSELEDYGLIKYSVTSGNDVFELKPEDFDEVKATLGV